MSKNNKVRYTSKGNQFPTITVTGRVAVKFVDDTDPAPQKGDLRLYLSTDSKVEEPGQYDAIGLPGYLKAEVWDARGWKPLSLEEFFSDREYYFGKREMPIDTIAICRPMLEKFTGRILLRTYREHYVLEK